MPRQKNSPVRLHCRAGLCILGGGARDAKFW